MEAVSEKTWTPLISLRHDVKDWRTVKVGDSVRFYEKGGNAVLPLVVVKIDKKAGRIHLEPEP